MVTVASYVLRQRLSYVGAWGVREGEFRPKLFIGVGAAEPLGEHGLLLAGKYEEFVRPARLQARTNTQVVIFPWSDHTLEAFDPVLVRAAVKAARATVGKPVSAAPTAWRRMRPAVLLIAIILTTGTWLGMAPQLRRIPQQLVLLPVIWLALVGLSRLRMPRWSLPVVTGILTLGVALGVTYANPTNIFPFVMLMIASYGIGQFMPFFY